MVDVEIDMVMASGFFNHEAAMHENPLPGGTIDPIEWVFKLCITV